MTLNRSKTLLTFSASLLLVAAYAASSDARPHAPYPTVTPGAVLTEDASTHNG